MRGRRLYNVFDQREQCSLWSRAGLIPTRNSGVQRVSDAAIDMEHLLNKLVREFYLGDDTALDKLFLLLRDRMCWKIKSKFQSLEFADIQDIVSDWFTNFFQKVRNCRKRAEIEGELLNLPPLEINERKISYCSEKPNFNLNGTPFNAWLWTVLYRDALDFSRTIGRMHIRQVEFETMDSPSEKTEKQWINDKVQEAREYQERLDAQIRGEKLFLEMSDREIARLMQKIEESLKSALDSDQLLYFRIWREHGYDPPGKTVREVFLKEQGKEINESSISRLKKQFLRFSYLVSLENLADAKNMSNLFWRLVKGKENEMTFFPPMMERIWRVFEEDAETVRESQLRISLKLWRKLSAAVQKNNLRSQILVAAYHYFQMRNESPRFVKLIDLYSEDRFGGEIRKLFSGGGAAN